MNKTLILGTALVDHLIYSPAALDQFICQKAPTELCGGGSARNVASNLALLETPIDFLTVWGNDAFATLLKNELAALGVVTYGPTVDLPTPVFTSLSAGGQHYTLSSISSGFYLGADFDFPYQNYDWIITDRSDASLLRKIIQLNPTIKILTMGQLPATEFQPNLAGVVLNRCEFHLEKSHHDYAKVAKEYPKDCFFVVTLDEAGLFYSLDSQSEFLANKTYQVDGYPVGCGDAFVAGLYAKLSRDYSFDQAISSALLLAEALYQAPGNVITKEMAKDFL